MARRKHGRKYPRIDCIDHVGCILSGGCDRVGKVNRILKSVIRDGREPVYIVGSLSLEGANPVKGTVIAVGHTDGIQIVAALDYRSEVPAIATFYPVGRPLGSVRPLCGECLCEETECDQEAYGRMVGEPLIFSVANYPYVKTRSEYRNGERCSFDFVGFCYYCERVDEESLEHPRMVELCNPADTTKGRYFSQHNEIHPDEFIFASTVYDMDEVKVYGLAMYRMKIMTCEGYQPFWDDRFVTVYARKAFFPDGLEVGNFVKGVGWLQGILCDRDLEQQGRK